MSTSTIKRPRRVPFSDPAPLTEEERKQFVAILEGDVFRKVLARAMNMKPGAFSGVSDASKCAADRVQSANDRLHEIRGWELFEHALYLQAQTPKPAAARTPENYPDQGLIDYE